MSRSTSMSYSIYLKIEKGRCNVQRYILPLDDEFDAPETDIGIKITILRLTQIYIYIYIYIYICVSVCVSYHGRSESGYIHARLDKSIYIYIYCVWNPGVAQKNLYRRLIGIVLEIFLKIAKSHKKYQDCVQSREMIPCAKREPLVSSDRYISIDIINTSISKHRDRIDG